MKLSPNDPLYIYELQGDARAGAGALGPDFLGLWLEGQISYLFFRCQAQAVVGEIIEAQAGLSLLSQHEMTYGQWQGGVGTESITLDGLWVLPAGSAEKPPAGTPAIWLDPGLVFGSGLHPTTRHSLELLVSLAGQGPLGRVLDLGCGTGILGLAAARLGAEQVLAVDLNPLCVSTTADNAALNELELEVAEGEAGDFLGQPATLLLANLHWDAMAALLELPQAWADKQDAILSGITRSQVGPLKAKLASLGYTILRELSAETTWFTLWASRRG